MLDPQLKKLINLEIRRQEETLDLIPSENFASYEVRTVIGSPLMNKYSEGYPGKRYYPGNVYYDEIERLAHTYALKTFNLKSDEWGVNVQPYSGSPANLAIYAALMAPGETLVGLALASGGHLTHGHKVNLSGRLYNTAQYSVDQKTGLLDYEAIERLGEEKKPRIIVSGLTAYPRTIEFERFGAIAKKVGAYHVADISHIAGLVAAGVHPSPFPYADAVMMTTHKTLAGPRGAVIFARRELMECIDKAVFPGAQGGPHNNTTAAIAQMFSEALHTPFKKYQAQIIKNAKALAETLLSFGGTLVTGGTDNHLMLMNVTHLGLTGMEAERMLEESGIIANRNSIPGDPSPFKPSGIRMGTPALTRRGMKEKEMKTVGTLIYKVLQEKQNVTREVRTLCKKFSAKKYLKP